MKQAETVPIQPPNATRRRQPKRFNPPLKKDANSSQPSASQDKTAPSLNEAITGTSTHTLLIDEDASIDGSTVSGTKSSRTHSKGTEKCLPPQHKVPKAKKGRKRGKQAVDINSGFVAESDAVKDGQEITTSTTSGPKRANKRRKRSEKEEERQMDFTSAEIQDNVPEDLECIQPADSKEEEMEESTGFEQVEERAHTVLSYCDESHYAGGNTMDANAQEEHISQRAIGGEDMEDSLLLDMVTRDVDIREHNASPHNLHPEPYHYMPSDKNGQPLEVDDLCLQIDHSQESESDAEQSGIPRRQFKVPRPRPCAYNFSILQSKPNTTASNKKPGQRKRVRVDENHNVSIPVVQGEEKRSVFDFQPSQEPTTTTTDSTMEDVCAGKEERGKSNKLNQSRSKMADVSYSTRTREEQLAVDLEVLRVIARTRMEIQAIRSKYTAMKAERESLPSVTQPLSRLPSYVTLVKSSRKSVQAVLPGPGIITQLVKEE